MGVGITAIEHEEGSGNTRVAARRLFGGGGEREGTRGLEARLG